MLLLQQHAVPTWKAVDTRLLLDLQSHTRPLTDSAFPFNSSSCPWCVVGCSSGKGRREQTYVGRKGDANQPLVLERLFECRLRSQRSCRPYANSRAALSLAAVPLLDGRDDSPLEHAQPDAVSVFERQSERQREKLWKKRVMRKKHATAADPPHDVSRVFAVKSLRVCHGIPDHDNSCHKVYQFSCREA